MSIWICFLVDVVSVITVVDVFIDVVVVVVVGSAESRIFESRLICLCSMVLIPSKNKSPKPLSKTYGFLSEILPMGVTMGRPFPFRNPYFSVRIPVD